MYNGNRTKSTRGRSPRDFYATPYELCVAALKKIKPLISDKFPYVLDPGCGDGIWGKAINTIFTDGENRVVGLDVDPSTPTKIFDFYKAVFCCDFLKYDCLIRYDLIMGNPPYSLNEQFIRKSLSLLDDNGILMFLMPLSFLGSQTRQKGLFAEHPPSQVWICSRRPSFFSVDGKHTTDTLEYAIYVWTKEVPKITTLDWITFEYEKK